MKGTRQPPAASKKASCYVNMGCHDDDEEGDGILMELLC